MCFSNTNLLTVYCSERSRNDIESVQEQLFDKLIKKALAYVLKISFDIHCYDLLMHVASERLVSVGHPIG